MRLRAEKPCLLQVKSYAFEAESRGPAVNVAGATRYVDAGGGVRAHLRPCSYFDVDYGELIVKDAAAAVWSGAAVASFQFPAAARLVPTAPVHVAATGSPVPWRA